MELAISSVIYPESPNPILTPLEISLASPSSRLAELLSNWYSLVEVGVKLDKKEKWVKEKLSKEK